MRPYTIAFHGRGGTPAMLRRDMGAPYWVDHYHRGLNLQQAAKLCAGHGRVFLVGYSAGGELVAKLTHCLANICGAVVYEAPLREPLVPSGTFPVCMVWNSRGRLGWPAGQRAAQLWDDPARVFVPMQGTGGHVRLSWRPPFISHAWDQKLNAELAKFYDYCSNHPTGDGLCG